MSRKHLFYKIFCWIVVIALFFLAFATLHALASSQGIGLYLAGLYGQGDQAFYDRIVDIAGMAALLLVLIVPFLIFRKRGIVSFFRLLIMYLALVPVVSMSMLVHLADGHELLIIEHNVINNLSTLAGLQEEVVPVALLSGCIYRRKGFGITGQQMVLIGLAVLSGIGMLCLPQLSEELMYWMAYLTMLLGFLWMETLFEVTKEQYEKLILWAVAGIFLGRGCYRMLEILEVFPFVWPQW